MEITAKNYLLCFFFYLVGILIGSTVRLLRLKFIYPLLFLKSTKINNGAIYPIYQVYCIQCFRITLTWNWHVILYADHSFKKEIVIIWQNCRLYINFAIFIMYHANSAIFKHADTNAETTVWKCAKLKVIN